MEGSGPDDACNHPDPVTDAALDWFVRLQQAPDDESLKSEFRAWCEQDGRHAEAFARLESLWELPELDVASRTLAARLDRQEGRLPFQPRQARRPNGWTMPLAVAAAGILVAIGIHQYPALMLQWRADYRTATGGRSDVTLPDGSRMTLNTASAVAIDFHKERRSVTLLEGEAFFDVVHDTQHPFRVSGSFGEVEVKGTAFSVRTDGAEDTVVLERGRIDVSRLSDLEDHAQLDPGEMVSVSSNSVSPVEKTDTANALAWLDGRIVFHEKPLAKVLDDLRRYYGGPIVTIDGRIGRSIVSGNYRLADPESVIRSLAEVAGASVTRLPGGVLILR
nr:FecR family protein [Labrys sp. WJW]